MNGGAMQRGRTMESTKQAVVRETAAEDTAALGTDSESSSGRQGGGVRQRWGQTDASQAQAVWLAQTMQEGHTH